MLGTRISMTSRIERINVQCGRKSPIERHVMSSDRGRRSRCDELDSIRDDSQARVRDTLRIDGRRRDQVDHFGRL